LEILRRLHARLDVIDDRRVGKLAQDKNRQGRKWFGVRLGGEIGRDRHLTEVKVERPAHAAESVDDRRDLDMLALNGGHRPGAVLKAFGVWVSRDRGLKNGHVILLFLPSSFIFSYTKVKTNLCSTDPVLTSLRKIPLERELPHRI